MAVNNPYTSVAIAGFNASPPTDDGAQTSANQVEWQKHVDKLGTPNKDMGEGINTNVLAAFDALVMTDDPAQETVIGAMAEFLQQVPMLAQRAKRADRAVLAEQADDLTQATENVVVNIQEFG